MGSIPFKIIINLNRVSTNLCKTHFVCCLGRDYKAHLAIVFMLVNFKVLGEISVSGEHQRILRALRKWNPNLSTSSSQRSPRLYSVEVTTASITPNKSYISFRFGEPTQGKPAPKLSSSILVTLISLCCPSLMSIRLHLQPRQTNVVQIWHNIAISLLPVWHHFSSHRMAGPSGSSLTLLSFVLPRDLLFHCQWDAALLLLC